MNYSDKRQQIPSGNPLANALVVLVGIVMIGLSLILGVVAFVAIGSVVLVTAAIIGVRVWWFQRKLQKSARAAQKGGAKATHKPAPPGSDSDVIEGEYRVVSRDVDDQ